MSGWTDGYNDQNGSQWVEGTEDYDGDGIITQEEARAGELGRSSGPPGAPVHRRVARANERVHGRSVPFFRAREKSGGLHVAFHPSRWLGARDQKIRRTERQSRR